MPIEIRELMIKAEVDSGASRGNAPQAGGGGLSEEAIQQIVDQVVEVMKNKKER